MSSPVTEPIPHEEPFVYHLLALHVARRTGIMTVRTPDRTVDIYLRDGIPVFAERDTLGGSLSLDLVRLGILSGQQYEAVVSRMTRELFESEQMRFAEVAIELGFLTHEEVNVQLEKQVRSTVAECMASKDVEVTFRASHEAVGPVANYPCPVQPMVLSGVKQYYDWARTENVWRPDAAAFAKLKLPAAEAAALYALKPDERRYISGIDGTKSVLELIQASALDILHSSHVIASLLLTEGVELFSRPPPKPEALETAAPVLSVESASTKRRLSSPLLAAVRPAVSVTVRVSERPPLPGPVLQPAVSINVSAGVEEPTQATAAVEASFSAESMPKSVAAASAGANEAIVDLSLSPEQRRLKAERLFAHGKRMLKSDALKRAWRSFAAAERLEPRADEYSLYAKWTAFLMHPPDNPDTALETLSRVALATLTRDKTHAYANYVYGRVAHARGDSETAKSALKNALKQDPSLLEAKTFLRVLVRH